MGVECGNTYGTCLINEYFSSAINSCTYCPINYENDLSAGPLNDYQYQISTDKLLTGERYGSFSRSISISNSYILIGAFYEADPNQIGFDRVGAAYLYEKDITSPSGFNLKHRLTASTLIYWAQFGASVSINKQDETTIAIGSTHIDNPVNYDFQVGGDWSEISQVFHSDASPSDQIGGHGLIISGDWLFVGSIKRLCTNSDPGCGATYIWKKNTTTIPPTWEEHSILTSVDQASYDQFGFNIDFSGDTLVVSAPGRACSQGADCGGAYVYREDQGGFEAWGAVATLVPYGGSSNGAEYAGYGISIFEDMIALGASMDGVGSAILGAVYIFERDQGGTESWGSSAKIIPNSGFWTQFGMAVSLWNHTLVVGAPQGDSISSGISSGYVHVYHKDFNGVGAWGEVVELHTPDGAGGNEIGASVRIQGDTIVYGAPNFGAGVGEAYLLDTSELFCNICPVGSQSLTVGNSCELCSAGTYGQLEHDWFPVCVDCAVGSVNPKNGSTTATDCLSCSIAGTYAPTPGMSEQCIGCHQGSFGTDAGTCINCPVGTFSQQIAANSSAACEPCSAGYFSATTGSTTCIPCDIGHAQPIPGQSQCDACLSGFWNDEIGSAQCKACPDGTISLGGAISLADCICTAGFYGLGSECKACPEGGVCDGSEFPTPLPGYWSHPDDPSIVAACTNPEACTGGSTSDCIEGYSGTMCSQCASGYYSLGIECKQCPAYSKFILPVILAALVLVVLLKLKYGSDISTSSTAFVSTAILINYAQILSIVPKYTLPWPPLLRRIFDWASLLNFNIEYASPECSVDMDFYEKSLVKLTLPIFLLMLFFVIGLPLYLLENSKKKKSKYGTGHNNNEAPGFASRAIGSYLSVFLLCYTMVASSVFDLLRCQEIGDNIFVLAAAPAKSCFTPEHEKWKLIAQIAYGFGALYFLVIPGIMALVFRRISRNRSALFDPKFQAVFSALVANYSPEWFWYELVILAKKIASLAGTVLGNPIDQLLLGLVSFFCFAMLQSYGTSYAQPFMASPLNKLELASTVSLLVTLFTGLLYLYWAQTPSETTFSQTLVLCLAVVGITITIGSAILSILRDLFSLGSSSSKRGSKITPWMNRTPSKLQVAAAVGKDNLTWMSDEQAFLIASTFRPSTLISENIAPKVATILKGMNDDQRDSLLSFLSILHNDPYNTDHTTTTKSKDEDTQLLSSFFGSHASHVTSKLNELAFQDRSQTLSALHELSRKLTEDQSQDQSTGIIRGGGLRARAKLNK